MIISHWETDWATFHSLFFPPQSISGQQYCMYRLWIFIAPYVSFPRDPLLKGLRQLRHTWRIIVLSLFQTFHGFLTSFTCTTGKLLALHLKSWSTLGLVSRWSHWTLFKYGEVSFLDLLHHSGCASNFLAAAASNHFSLALIGTALHLLWEGLCSLHRAAQCCVNALSKNSSHGTYASFPGMLWKNATSGG